MDATIKRAREHFDWLACCHFDRLTVKEIAHLDGESWLRDYDSISLAINDAAARCGLTLNRQRGRPPKTDS